MLPRGAPRRRGGSLSAGWCLRYRSPGRGGGCSKGPFMDSSGAGSALPQAATGPLLNPVAINRVKKKTVGEGPETGSARQGRNPVSPPKENHSHHVPGGRADTGLSHVAEPCFRHARRSRRTSGRGRRNGPRQRRRCERGGPVGRGVSPERRGNQHGWTIPTPRGSTLTKLSVDRVQSSLDPDKPASCDGVQIQSGQAFPNQDRGTVPGVGGC